MDKEEKRMKKLKRKNLVKEMERLKGTRKFNGKMYELFHHEHYGDKRKALKDAEYYSEEGAKVRVVSRGKGVYSIYVRKTK